MASSEYFTEEQNLADLVSLMPPDDQRRFKDFGHFRIEAAFVNRVFVVYKPTGLTPSGRHKEPEVLTTVRVTDFNVSARSGCVVTLEDQGNGQEMVATHVPKKLFQFPIYVSIPPRLTIRWDARVVDGAVMRSMSFAIFVKTKNKSTFYSKGNVYAEVPNKFLELYPGVSGTFKF